MKHEKVSNQNGDHYLKRSENFIFIKTEYKGKFVKVLISQICYIEGCGNYLAIFTEDGNKTIAYATFQELYAVLPSNFIRVHKSFLVSLNHITSIDGNQIRIENKCEPIPLGLTYRESFFKTIETKIIGGKNKAKSNRPTESGIPLGQTVYGGGNGLCSA